MDSGRSTPTLPDELDLTHLPPVFVLSAHINTDSLVQIEDLLTRRSASLTYDASEARVFIGRIEQRRRAIFELKSLKVLTEELPTDPTQPHDSGSHDRPAKKRRRLDPGGVQDVITIEDSSTESESETVATETSMHRQSPNSIDTIRTDVSLAVPEDQVVVLKMSWLEDSISRGRAENLSKYMIYNGRRIAEKVSSEVSSTLLSLPQSASILARARADLGPERGQSNAAFASTSQQKRKHVYNPRTLDPSAHIPTLMHQTTSEYDADVSPNELPRMPEWVVRRSTYSCERATPANPPNAAFIAQLIMIRTARKLTADEIGVRAYSTSIAAVAAYPYTLTSTREIHALPGCEGKIARLWAEWQSKNTAGVSSPSPSLSASEPVTSSKTSKLLQGQVLIDAAREAQDDPKLTVLRLFYDIWGVGDKTAREFYENGWRDLDDVVEYGWQQLSRVQQIGVKYYDEFLLKIPRSEVEFIAAKIHAAAQKVARDAAGVRSCIVGGYRRGKLQSGDVDVIISHVDESETIDYVQEIVRVLVDEGWITHELITSLSGSRRGQATLPFRNMGGGHGFDTLDKSLVVWQDPHWPGRKELKAQGLSQEQIMKKNPNVHRRVDIIIAPWSKIGCAVLGWTAGTTFERDLRRYAKKVKGWKFDSSGIRDRLSGLELDFENGDVSSTPEEAERKVFAGLGLEYREPWERCTF